MRGSSLSLANEVPKTSTGVIAKTSRPISPLTSLWLKCASTLSAIRHRCRLAPPRGHLSVGDALTPASTYTYHPAPVLLHLTAADEHRHISSLNAGNRGPRELVLPGVHSNLGGGYPTLSRARRLARYACLFLGNTP